MNTCASVILTFKTIRLMRFALGDLLNPMWQPGIWLLDTLYNESCNNAIAVTVWSWGDECKQQYALSNVAWIYFSAHLQTSWTEAHETYYNVISDIHLFMDSLHKPLLDITTSAAYLRMLLWNSGGNCTIAREPNQNPYLSNSTSIQ